MLKNALLTFAFGVLFSGFPVQSATAKTLFTNVHAYSTIALPSDFTGDIFRLDGITVKRGEPYDEKKDPALRKGTENEEMPQGSFFAIPALVLGMALVFLFFNRD